MTVGKNPVSSITKGSVFMYKPQHLPEALGEYARRQVARFHMPGHKGRGMGGFFHEKLAGWDGRSFPSRMTSCTEAIYRERAVGLGRCFGAALSFFCQWRDCRLPCFELTLPSRGGLTQGRVVTARACSRGLGRFIMSFRRTAVVRNSIYGRRNAETWSVRLACTRAGVLVIS
jgi:hypothetical protein